jgi:Pyruvate phosphate dikinase, AMP/ATP-binding domain
MTCTKTMAAALPTFDRRFWDGRFRFTRIGQGALGGKATGLAFIKDLVADGFDPAAFPGVEVSIPVMAVIATDCFDQFIQQNRLDELVVSEVSDTEIGVAFQHADLPIELLGDLRALVQQVTTPLAVRSSSLLEDALGRPFAGVYATKMIPNNQFDADTRFRRLVEAIKFVYASTFFREARDYIRTTGADPHSEKMAVIIQEIVGLRYRDRFYPHLSGVARSLNYYPTAAARPEEGVVTLALGLGKTIVDGGIAWTYSPGHPKAPPPFGSVGELLRATQTKFWAVNMGKPPAYDPVNEAEYMVQWDLAAAEDDESLDLLASTYDPARDRVIASMGIRGPRVLNFYPLLVREDFPLNAVIKKLLQVAEESTGAKVEIEFAITFNRKTGELPRMRLGFLQVRPMVVSEEQVEVTLEELSNDSAIVASSKTIGNGIAEIEDVVFVRPERFSVTETAAVARDLERMNASLVAQRRPYLLIGFGRWGSSHSSLGIPVDWSQISGAKAIVESTLPQMSVELSQGSHFFHNLSSFQTSYFMVQHEDKLGINWKWLNEQPVVQESEFVRHVRPAISLIIKVDGRTMRGIILPNRNTDTQRAK